MGPRCAQQAVLARPGLGLGALSRACERECEAHCLQPDLGMCAGPLQVAWGHDAPSRLSWTSLGAAWVRWAYPYPRPVRCLGFLAAAQVSRPTLTGLQKLCELWCQLSCSRLAFKPMIMLRVHGQAALPCCQAVMGWAKCLPSGCLVLQAEQLGWQ